MKTAIILGAGFSGQAIGRRLHKNGWSVWGTTRSKSNIKKLEKANVNPILFDGEQASDELRNAINDSQLVVVSIAPPREQVEHGYVDPTLRTLGGEVFATQKTKKIVYLSTVGVYGNHNGEWIDEKTEPNPVSERSKNRVRAEQEWQKVQSESETDLTIFRLSGIYGPGRNALLNAHLNKGQRLVKKGQVFNRIHVEDIAKAVGLVAHQNSAGQASGVFNITDDEPAPPQDVVTFAYRLMNKKPPEEVEFESAELTPMARSFYGENKRVSNQKSKNFLGVEYDYPNYRTALKRMCEEETWGYEE